jgi:hypothetical protein
MRTATDAWYRQTLAGIEAFGSQPHGLVTAQAIVRQISESFLLLDEAIKHGAPLPRAWRVAYARRLHNMAEHIKASGDKDRADLVAGLLYAASIFGVPLDPNSDEPLRPAAWVAAALQCEEDGDDGN